MEARPPSMQGPLRIFCKKNQNYNMAVRNNQVILVRADPNDKSQHWFQDYDAVGKLTDDQGRRAFALVNRTTGQAMVNINHVVKLAPYSPHVGVMLSMLWSLGSDLGGGFAEVRTLKDLSMTINAINGYVQEGTLIGMYNSEPHSSHAIWKFDPIPITDQ